MSSAFYLAVNRPVEALVADAGGGSLIKEGIAELEVALPGRPDDREPPTRTSDPGDS